MTGGLEASRGVGVCVCVREREREREKEGGGYICCGYALSMGGHETDIWPPFCQFQPGGIFPRRGTFGGECTLINPLSPESPPLSYKHCILLGHQPFVITIHFTVASLSRQKLCILPLLAYLVYMTIRLGVGEGGGRKLEGKGGG